MTKPARRYVQVGAMVFAALLAPAAATLGIPLACSIGSDLFDSAWIAATASLVAAMIAFNAQRRATRLRRAAA